MMWEAKGQGIGAMILVCALCACGDEITNQYSNVVGDGGTSPAPAAREPDPDPDKPASPSPMDAGTAPTPAPSDSDVTDECACQADTCHGDGQCLCAGGSTVCLCDPGFAGSDCTACAPGHSRTPDGERCAALLQVARVEPAGMDCASGGVAIESGLDLDGNGSLQASEVTETAHVCNAESGRSQTCQSADCTCTDDTCNGHGACVSGTTGLVCLCDAGHGGARCQACQTGYIDDGSGTCKRPDELTDVQLEPAGANCAQGGDVVLRGLDLNDNGSLDAGEVLSRSYACTTAVVRTGNVVVSNQAQLNDLADVTAIDGSLTIRAPHITDLSPLSHLSQVSGDLRVEACPELTSVAELANLGEVGGSVEIVGNASLPDLGGLGGLVRVGASLEVRGNGALTDITGFDTVRRISGDLLIADNAKLADVSGLGGLQYVGGRVQIEHNPALASLTGLAALTSVVDRMVVQKNPKLAALSGLSALDAVGGPLILYGNDALKDLNGLAKLRDTGTLVIEGNGALTDIDGLVALRSLRNGLQVRENGGLTEVSGLGALLAVDGDIVIHDNSALTSITGFGALTRVKGAIVITDNDKLATLDAFDSLIQLGLLDWPGFPCGVMLQNSQCIGPALQYYFPRFSPHLCSRPLNSTYPSDSPYLFYYDYAHGCPPSTGPNALSLQIANNADLVSIAGFGALTQLEVLAVQNNPTLERIDGLPIATAGLLYVEATPTLSDFSSLATVQDVWEVHIDDSGLRTLDLARLDTVQRLRVIRNAELTAMAADPDGEVTGTLVIQDNPELATCEAQGFADAHQTGGSRSISGNNDAGVCP